jgi:hypothetical protein
MADGSPFGALEPYLFGKAPPPAPRLVALGERFVAEAKPRFRNFRVDLEKIEGVAAAAGRDGAIDAEDARALLLDHGDVVSLPLVRRYIEACETELVARWLMSRPSFHFAGWASVRNLTALDGMVAAGEPALAVRLVRKHLEKTHARARGLWRSATREPKVIPPEYRERYEARRARALWELPGEIETARLELAELEAVVRAHGSPEDNRALDAKLGARVLLFGQ